MLPLKLAIPNEQLQRTKDVGKLCRIIAWSACLAGCGHQGVDLGPFGTVSGRVTYKGVPVEEGVITFHCPDSGQVANAGLSDDGRYRIKLEGRDGLPIGNYNVYIRPPLLDYKERARLLFPDSGRAYNPQEYPNIPMDYRFESSSGLKATVEEGENTFDFDMSNKVDR